MRCFLTYCVRIAFVAVFAINSVVASTNLTGLGTVNDPVPSNHGSNAAGTPSIELSWIGNWDQYPGWDGRGDVYQIEGATVASPHRIELTPDPGYAVTIASFDLDEWVGGGDTVVAWTISGPVSGNLATGTWDNYNAANDPSDSGGRSSITPNVSGVGGETLTLSIAQTGGDQTYLAMDNLSFDQVAINPDNTAPTLLDIVDDKGGDPILDNDTVVYTITFSEPINATTIDIGDFENAGSPDASVEAVTATDDPAVYEVTVTPGSGNGTLQLQIKPSAVIEDFSGNVLVTNPLLTDSEVITVTVAPFILQITAGASGFDFSWNSQPDMVYDVVSSSDLSTPVSTWPVYDDGTRVYENILASKTVTNISAVPSMSPRRFFAIRERDPGKILRVLSWNIWTADSNYAKINEVIQTTKADVIGFQELSGVASTVSSLETATGQDWHSHGMIISRYPIIETSGNGAHIRISPEQTVWVFNIHFSAYPYQPYDLRDGTLAQNEAAVIAAAESARGGQATSLVNTINNSGAMAANIPIFVTGDFNEPSQLDWTTAAANATPRPYDLKVEYPASKKMTDLGLADAYRTVWPDEIARPGYTWTPGYPPPSLTVDEVHDRIDFVYFWGPSITALDATTVGYDIANPNTDIAITGYPSDHRAVLGTFAIPEPSP